MKNLEKIEKMLIQINQKEKGNSNAKKIIKN